MIRPNMNVTTMGGVMLTLYPPLQWNACTSERKMLDDCRVWLHNHQPSWTSATINLKHYNYTKTIKVKRRCGKEER